MDGSIARVDLHDVVDEQKFHHMPAVDSHLGMLRQDNGEHGRVPGMLRAVLAAATVHDRRLAEGTAAGLVFHCRDGTMVASFALKSIALRFPNLTERVTVRIDGEAPTSSAWAVGRGRDLVLLNGAKVAAFARSLTRTAAVRVRAGDAAVTARYDSEGAEEALSPVLAPCAGEAPRRGGR